MTTPTRLIEEARKLAQNCTPYDAQPGMISEIAKALLAAEQRGREAAAQIVESRGRCRHNGEEWVDFPSRELANVIRSRSEEPKP